jgi:protein tyrosine/serine phosphatase
MRNRSSKLTASACAIALLVSMSIAGAAQSEPTYKELPNLHKVSDTLYRGAQPLNGFARKLGELGVKTIINLRGVDEISQGEQKEAEAAGLRYFNIAMPGLSAPSDDQVSRVMAIIDNPESQPVFIHCKRGADRTGTIAAVYRMSHEGWNAERALAEAKHFGMSWAEFGMKGYIADYYKQHLRTTSQSTAATTR